ncbi:hypothetical protein EJH27_01815 [Salmonella enterica subsp. enterica serovar Virchow]|nr:hypothetical protein [Salmonella enterica subsp. enterica serovar Virchow]
MDNEGFNPEDIEDTLSRHGARPKHLRSTTAGIPDFIPRSQSQKTSTGKFSFQPESVHTDVPPPPETTCFSQADIDEFLARKPKKHQMNERDYKELGRNIYLGVGDLIVGTVQAAAIVNEVIPDNKEPTSGWGYDIDGNFDFYGPSEWGVTYKKR